MGCDGCDDVCNCVVQAGDNITVTGSGSAVDPYIVSNSFVETTFSASSPGGTITINPGGTNGHEPELDVDSCALYETGEVESAGQLFVVSPDPDCKPHVLVDPAPGQVLGEVGGEAAWVDGGALGGDIPTGASLEWNAAAAPAGYLLEDGASYLVADFLDLFNVIGYTFGGGGANFNVPDSRGRVAVMVGTHGDVDVIGDTDAIALASRRPAHVHTVNAHNHTFADTSTGPNSINTGGAAGYAQIEWNAVTDPHNGAANRLTQVSVPTAVHTHAVAGTTSSESPGTSANGPAWITKNKIIKT
jgi:microcystin-dependent protein